MPALAQYWPFSTHSTMKILADDDVSLPFNFVYGAFLYPRIKTTDDIDALHVSVMYTRFTDKGVEHHWTVSNTYGSLLLDVVFRSYDIEGYPKGMEAQKAATGYVMQGNFNRGVVRCAPGYMEYVETLPVLVELQPDALVFDPTVVRFRENSGFQELHFADGTLLKDVQFDPDDFLNNEGTTEPKTEQEMPREIRTPVKEIIFDGSGNEKLTSTERLQHASIVAAKNSGVRVLTESGEIQIGRGLYL